MEGTNGRGNRTGRAEQREATVIGLPTLSSHLLGAAVAITSFLHGLVAVVAVREQ